MAKLVTSSWFLSLILVACADGNCRQIQSKEQVPAHVLAAMPVAPAAPEVAGHDMADDKRVLVYKSDGSLQCQQGGAKALDDMAKELKGIKILSSLNKSDGRMHVQVCGTPTGKVNVYEIFEKDLAKAQKKGFKLWNFD
jgi:hypothetical protein